MITFGRIASAWYDAADVCPICRTGQATHIVKGTDRRVCTDCIGGIPYDLHATEGHR